MGPSLRRAAALCLLLPSAGLGCGQDALSRFDDDSRAPSPQDRPVEGVPSAGAIEAIRIVEEFNSRFWIDVQNGTDLDLNRGELTLATIDMPVLAGTGAIEITDQLVGTVSSEMATVPESATVVASGAPVIEATTRIEIAGDLVVGTEGIILDAGEEIVITGTIRTDGRVGLRVSSETGRIVMNGTILRSGENADVAILTRGDVVIGGRIIPDSQQTPSAGTIEVLAYGTVRIDSGAELTARARNGASGAVMIASGSNEAVGLEVGSATIAATGAPGAPALIELVGSAMHFDGSLLEGIADDGPAKIILASSSTITLTNTVVRGDGFDSETHGVQILAAEILSQSTRIETPAAVAGGSDILMAITGSVGLDDGTQILGGDTDCGAGGDIIVEAAGTLSVGLGAELRAGDATGTDCGGASTGGSISVLAPSVVGDLMTASAAGTGDTDGQFSFSATAPPERLDYPNRLQNRGTATSKWVDRGGAWGLPPVLVETVASGAPELVSVALAGSNDPSSEISEFFDLPEDADRLRAFRFFKYRITLDGQSFDAPAADRVVIDLVGDGQ